MLLSFADWIGIIGVALLLIAFLLQLLNKISKDSFIYICMNLTGAILACYASYLIHYLPFVILEATWAIVSAIALIQYFTKR